MRLLKLLLGFLALAFLCLAAVHAEPVAASASDASPSRRIVVFGPSTSPSDRVAIASKQGRVVRTLDLIDAVVIETPAVRAASAVAGLKAHPAVLRVDEDPKINWLTATQAPELPFPSLSEFPKLVGAKQASSTSQEIPWGVARVKAPEAWATTRGEGVKVAVIDTGIEASHPDLAGNVKGGWNAIAKSDDFHDDNGHGTHVSGTIAALDDHRGVVGVAPKAELYGVKVLDANGSGTYDDVIAGMQWAVDHHMQVANMSLGASKGNDSLKAAVDAMVKGGVALVAAAGNSGPDADTVGYPAGYPGAIAVAALDDQYKVAYFSSRGPAVAVIAPGVSVKSTYMGGGYDTLDGTSMATPHVTGLAALAIAAKHLSGYDAVRAALVKSASFVAGTTPEEAGAGLPDACKLVR